MTDFKAIARILGAIRAYEGKQLNMAALSPDALGVDEATRDLLTCKLRQAGYVDGLITSEDIDNAPRRVFWEASTPSVTLAGLEYMAECKPLREAAKELTKAAVTAGIAATANALSLML